MFPTSTTGALPIYFMLWDNRNIVGQKPRQPIAVRESMEGYGVVMAERGRLVLPAALRERLALKTGDRLLVTEEADGSLRLTPRADLVRHLQGSWTSAGRKRRRSDELLAERRRDAARESSE